MSNLKLSILIPAFNEEGRIFNVINDCKKYFKYIAVVNDGSTDKTALEIEKGSPSVVLNHSINCGNGTALSTGLKYFLSQTNAQYLVTLDGDTQHSAEDAYKMIEYASKNMLEAVFGSRFLIKSQTNRIPKYRKFMLHIARFFERTFYGIKLTDAHNGLKVLSRRACIELKHLQSSSMAHCTEVPLILNKKSIEIVEYPIHVNYAVKNKKSQPILNSLNIVSDLLQRK